MEQFYEVRVVVHPRLFILNRFAGESGKGSDRLIWLNLHLHGNWEILKVNHDLNIE